nr:lipoprotein [uncultured Ruminococcus sp.]
MKRMIIAFLAVLILSSCVLSACGGNKTDSTPDQASVDQKVISETTVILETTAEGGTVEQDKEGNKITKDKEGKILSIEDKNGNPIDVAEYLTTHTLAENSVISDGSDNTADSGKSGKSSSGASAESGDKRKSESKDVDTEGEVPVVIATIPSDEELAELPDL